MSGNITKTYMPLSQLAGAAVKSCTALLPNKLQCWRAGDVQVIKQEVTPATKDENGEEIAEVAKKQEYQLCYRHAQLEQAQDAFEEQAEDEKAAAEAAAKVTVPPAATATPTTVTTKKAV